MTQRIFDVENEKDMADLWDILPDKVYLIARGICDSDIRFWYNTPGGKTSANCYLCDFLKINWHDKTEITRPIQEATFDDVGKLCIFWNENEKNNFGILEEITSLNNELRFWKNNTSYKHCRRLTKQEIEEIC